MSNDRKQVGWQLIPIHEAQPGTVQTQAFILCCVCKKAIASTGGPRSMAYCLECVVDDGKP